MLDYPAPTLIAWNDSFTDEALLGGGSHIAKITSVLEYLEAMPESAQNDIVGMFDAYGRSKHRSWDTATDLTVCSRHLVPTTT